MQKVQTVSLRFVEDVEFLKEQYEMLGFIVAMENDEMVLYWGKKPKPKKEKEEPQDKEKKPERRSKTERRLGRKYERVTS